MTEPDEALIWAREYWAARFDKDGLPISAGHYRSGRADSGLKTETDAYRAGQAASAARIKALEVALRDALPRLENCVKDHVWHTQRPPVPHYIVNIRALLKEAGQ